MKKNTITALFLFFALLLTACGNSNTVVSSVVQEQTEVSSDTVSEELTDKKTDEVSVENAVSDEEKVEKEDEKSEETAASSDDSVSDFRHNYILTNSIQSTGNNYRLKKVLDKARNGETVNMAALGGSITEGAGAKTNHEGYAYLFAEAFKETYCSGDNLNYVNAGLSGTPSPLGALRYEKDVVTELGCEPDLLIIEFAVNDYNEPTEGRALESLIYQALSANEDCAVILLFSVSESKWSAATSMQTSGFYYSLPMVNMKRALDTGMVSDDDYFYDEYHPAPFGHQLTCDCLMKLIATIDEEAEDELFVIPEEEKYGRDFTNMKLATPSDSEVTIEAGAFNLVDTEVQRSAFKNAISFPENYKKNKELGNDPLKFTLKASHILISYKTASSSSYGKADIYVDGQVVMTLNGHDSAGWNNCNVALILDEKEVANHTVEIKMADGSEDKLFTFLALAYN